MKGQTQAVTAVMITGILVGTLAAVYVWGTPLLEKRESQTQINQIENDVLALEEEIGSVANNGNNAGGDATIRLNNGRVYLNESENYIEVSATGDSSRYPQETWRLLEGNNLQGLSIASGKYGIVGQDDPGVVAVKSTLGAESVRYRVEFRDLLDERFETPQVQKIDLQASGATESTGRSTVSIVNRGTEVDENGFELQTGEEIDHIRTVLEVTLK